MLCGAYRIQAAGDLTNHQVIVFAIRSIIRGVFCLFQQFRTVSGVIRFDLPRIANRRFSLRVEQALSAGQTPAPAKITGAP